MAKVLQFANIADFAAYALEHDFGPVYVSLKTRGRQPHLRLSAPGGAQKAIFVKYLYGGQLDQADQLARVKQYIARQGLALAEAFLQPQSDP